jgi:putative cell wall-binding protein
MDPKSKVYGDADPAYTHKVVGEFAGNDTLDSIATLTAKRTAGENVGTYDVTYVVTMKNTNYVVTVVSSTLTITAETEVTVEDILGATYTGSEIKPAVVVKANGKVLDASEYTVTYTNNVNVGTATVKVTVGGNYNAVIEKSFAISAKSLDGAVISGVEDKEYTGSAITQDVVVTLDGKTLVEGTDYVVTYKNNVNVGVATVVVTGKGNYAGKVSKEFTVIKTVDENVYRLFGDDRYGTAYQVALTLKEKLGVDKFDTVVIASGMNFADALSGTYLANKYNAPILMTDSKDKNVAQLKAFINEHAVKGAKVYILGGNAAVKNNVDKALKGYDVKRLAGATRYETNLEILKEVGVGNETIIVATGMNFADSLSASATGLPILLVDKSLSKAQTQYLKSAGQHSYVIAGGTAAVSEKVEKQMEAFGQVERLAGSMRYQTSVMIAERFFNNPDYAVVALATNFPDGLSGGALAYALDAPMLLTNKDANNYKITSAYSKENDIHYGYVLGGSGLVTDKAVSSVFSMDGNRKIVVKKYGK